MQGHDTLTVCIPGKKINYKHLRVILRAVNKKKGAQTRKHSKSNTDNKQSLDEFEVFSPHTETLL